MPRKYGTGSLYYDRDYRNAVARTRDRVRLPIPIQSPAFQSELARQLRRTMPTREERERQIAERKQAREQKRLARQSIPEWDEAPAEEPAEVDSAVLRYDPPSAAPRAVMGELADVIAAPACDEAKVAALAAPDRIADAALALRLLFEPTSDGRLPDPFRHLVDRFNERVRLARIAHEFGIEPGQLRSADPCADIVTACMGECDWPRADIGERAAFVLGRIAATFMRSRGFA